MAQVADPADLGDPGDPGHPGHPGHGTIAVKLLGRGYRPGVRSRHELEPRGGFAVQRAEQGAEGITISNPRQENLAKAPAHCLG